MEKQKYFCQSCGREKKSINQRCRCEGSTGKTSHQKTDKQLRIAISERKKAEKERDEYATKYWDMVKTNQHIRKVLDAANAAIKDLESRGQKMLAEIQRLKGGVKPDESVLGERADKP